MKKYICIKEIKIPLLTVMSFEEGAYKTIPVGSMWELNSDIDCGYEENHLESIDSSTNVVWIEIEDEVLKSYFEEV